MVIRKDQPDKFTSLPDPQSACGYAVVGRLSPQQKVDKGVSCYLWDWGAAKRHPLRTIPLSAFKRDAYTLVKLGVTTLSPDCSLIFAENWGSPLAQRFLTRAFDPSYPKKKFEIWASLKAEGPKFFSGDMRPDALFIEQLFAIEVVGSGN